jgi:hypothetical protein
MEWLNEALKNYSTEDQKTIRLALNKVDPITWGILWEINLNEVHPIGINQTTTVVPKTTTTAPTTTKPKNAGAGTKHQILTSTSKPEVIQTYYKTNPKTTTKSFIQYDDWSATIYNWDWTYTYINSKWIESKPTILWESPKYESGLKTLAEQRLWVKTSNKVLQKDEVAKKLQLLWAYNLAVGKVKYSNWGWVEFDWNGNYSMNWSKFVPIK